MFAEKKFPDTCGHGLYLSQKKKELGDIYHDSIIIIIVIVDLADHSCYTDRGQNKSN